MVSAALSPLYSSPLCGRLRPEGTGTRAGDHHVIPGAGVGQGQPGIYQGLHRGGPHGVASVYPDALGAPPASKTTRWLHVSVSRMFPILTRASRHRCTCLWKFEPRAQWGLC